MSIQFTKPAGSIGTAVQKIRAEVGEAIAQAGMPRKLYLTLSEAPIEGHDSLEGNASLTQKDGRVMFNFGGRSTVQAVVGRLQGNFFLPKDGWTVDTATLKAYQEARKAQDAARSATRK